MIQIKDWLYHLNSFGDFNLLWIFFIENLLLIVLSVFVGLIIEFQNTVFNKKDFKWIFSTLVCNTLVTFIGFKLFIFNYIQLSFEFSIPSFLVDLLWIYRLQLIDITTVQIFKLITYFYSIFT